MTNASNNDYWVLLPESQKRAEAGKAVRADDGVAVRVVVIVVALSGVAVLPTVVEAHVTVAQITERRRHIIHSPLSGRNALEEILAYVQAEEVPAPPAHRREPRKAVAVSHCGTRQEREEQTTAYHDGARKNTPFLRNAGQTRGNLEPYGGVRGHRRKKLQIALNLVRSDPT